MAEPHELSTEECDRLLRSGVVGRVALSSPDGPHIVPVNYSVVDDMVVFRTTPYSVLGTYGRNAQLAFEVDHFDDEYETGWSVVARGRADAVLDADEVQRINEAWRPRPWASGSRNLYLAVRWSELSGRRLGPPTDPGLHLAVHGQAAGG
ncbi:MAG: pyridoxamine 5'-phosphate oxidase family protein [Propionibacteriales bacterium]|nr:pyridoxamine 5'-phosphate oxidase family protein [Propionibacteriales bacterium]